MVRIHETVVTDPQPETTDVIREERRWSFDGSDVIALLAGLLYTVLGAVALVKLGVGDFPSEETTQVADLTMTQMWASICIGLGLLFLAGVGSIGRSITTFAGAVAVVMGLVVVAALDEFDAMFATEEAFGWIAVAVGAIVLIATIAMPSMASSRGRVVDRTA